MHTLLVQEVIDSLQSHIAVLDEHGVIIAVNQAWIEFARTNGCSEFTVGVGADYLSACQHAAEVQGNVVAAEVINGIQNVLNGTLPDFSAEYACHSPTEERWFAMRVRPLNEGHNRVLVTHENITGFQRSAEQAREAAKQQEREAQALSCIACSKALTQGDLERLGSELTRRAALAVGVERAGIWLADETKTCLNNEDTFHLSQDAHTQEDPLQLQQLEATWEELQNARYLAVDDALRDPRTSAFAQAQLAALGTFSVLIAAIRSGEELLGILSFEQRDTLRHWEQNEITFACQMADQVALAIANQKRLRAEDLLRNSEEQLKRLNQEYPSLLILKAPKSKG